MSGSFPGDDLQLDLLTVVARIRQLNEEMWWDNDHLIWRRIVECDLPRLESHLHPDVKRWMKRMDEEGEDSTASRGRRLNAAD